MRTLILFLIMSLTFSGLAFGHPPSRMEVAYDLTSQTLKAEIYHFSRNVKTHNIRTAVIFKNEEKIDTIYFQIQTQNNMHVLEKPITAAAGDRISVKVYCNKGGTLEKSIIVEEAQPKAE